MVAGVITSFFVFASTLVFTPQKALQNVLGLSDVAQVRTVTETVDTTTNAAVEVTESTTVDRVSTFRENAAARREEFLQEAQTRREEFRAEAVERHAQAREEMEKKREEAKLRLQEIRDEKKREIATHVCERIDELNSTLTARFTEGLGRLTEIAGKIEERSAVAAEKGFDTASCSENIDTLHAAISSAQDAVNQQAGNTYVCEIPDDEHLGESIKGVKDELHEDLSDVRGRLKQAHSAAKIALRCLQSVRGVDDVE